jgi:hypothetical protein
MRGAIIQDGIVDNVIHVESEEGFAQIAATYPSSFTCRLLSDDEVCEPGAIAREDGTFECVSPTRNHDGTLTGPDPRAALPDVEVDPDVLKTPR